MEQRWTGWGGFFQPSFKGNTQNFLFLKDYRVYRFYLCFKKRALCGVKFTYMENFIYMLLEKVGFPGVSTNFMHDIYNTILCSSLCIIFTQCFPNLIESMCIFKA
jgi:hypothetical protein